MSGAIKVKSAGFVAVVASLVSVASAAPYTNTWNAAEGKCECDAQHVLTTNGRSCVLECGEAEYDSAKDQCDCEAGKIFVTEGKKCVPDCDEQGEWDAADEKCHCKLGFEMSNDKLHCVEKPGCDEGMVWRDSENECVPDCDGHG